MVSDLEERLLGVDDLCVYDRVHVDRGVIFGNDLLPGNFQDLGPQVELDNLVDQRGYEVQSLVQNTDITAQPHVHPLLVGLYDLYAAHYDH